MTEHDEVSATVHRALRDRLGDRVNDYLVPPPAFTTMQGEFVAFTPEEATLTARFPVLTDYLNPYNSLQGGMVAAAVDNTLGPLSLLIAAPSVTRRLEMIYSRPATLEMGHILVTARLLKHEGRWLTLSAEVCAPDGTRLARAKATHWVLDEG